jgi:hypothetical protein
VGGYALTLNPGSDLYPRYLADPRRPRCGVEYVGMIHHEVPRADGTRLDVAIGGRWPLIRISPWDDADKGFQFDCEGAFLSQFDLAHQLDDIGWDGWYAANFVFSPGGPVRFKLAARHLSAHNGDRSMAHDPSLVKVAQDGEYTREDFTGGIAYTPLDGLTWYGEGGWAHALGNHATQKRFAGQTGLQYERPGVFWGGRAGWYAAGDAQFFQENDWVPGLTGQVGLVLPIARDKRYRIGLEGHWGRAVLGQYSQLCESSLAFGIWLDL